LFRERDKLDDDSLLYIAERSHLVQREGKCKPIEHLYSPEVVAKFFLKQFKQTNAIDKKG